MSPDQTRVTPHFSHANTAVLFASSRDFSCRAACGLALRLLQIWSWQAGHLTLARIGKFSGPSKTGFMLGTMRDMRRPREREV